MSLRQGSSSFKPAERDFMKKRVSAWALHKSHASLDPSSNLSAPTIVLAGEKADDALQIRATRARILLSFPFLLSTIRGEPVSQGRYLALRAPIEGRGIAGKAGQNPGRAPARKLCRSRLRDALQAGQRLPVSLSSACPKIIQSRA